MKPNVMKETAQLRLHDNEKNTACHYLYQESDKYTAKYPALSRRNLLYGKRVSTTASCRQFGGTARKKEIN